jgi:hypothetical protein
MMEMLVNKGSNGHNIKLRVKIGGLHFAA